MKCKGYLIVEHEVDRCWYTSELDMSIVPVGSLSFVADTLTVNIQVHNLNLLNTLAFCYFLLFKLPVLKFFR